MLTDISVQREEVPDINEASKATIEITRMVESGGWDRVWKRFDARTEKLRRSFFDLPPHTNVETDNKRSDILAEIHYRQKLEDEIKTFVQNSLSRRK